MDGKPAARVGDSIEHEGRDSFMMGLIGGLAGAALGALIVGTGGGILAVGFILSVAGAGKTIGDIIDSQLLSGGSDIIDEGARTVFVNTQYAAKAHPDTKLDHEPEWVMQGAEHVFYENANASRKDDETTCPGKIISGSPDTYVGGVAVNAPGSPEDRDHTPTWYRVYDRAMFWGGLLTANPQSKRDFGCLAYGVGSDVYTQMGGEVPDAVNLGAMVVCTSLTPPRGGGAVPTGTGS